MHDATHDDRDRPRALERDRSALGATTMRRPSSRRFGARPTRPGSRRSALRTPSATSCGASRSPRARTVAAAGPRSPPRHVASHGDPGSPDRGDRAPPRARGRARRPRLRADRRGSPAGRPPSSRRLIGRRNEALPLRDQRDSVRAGLVAVSAARRTAGRPRCPSSDVAPAGGRPAPPSRHPPNHPPLAPLPPLHYQRARLRVEVLRLQRQRLADPKPTPPEHGDQRPVAYPPSAPAAFRHGRGRLCALSASTPPPLSLALTRL